MCGSCLMRQWNPNCELFLHLMLIDGLGWSWIWTANHTVNGQPTVHPEPQKMKMMQSLRGGHDYSFPIVCFSLFLRVNNYMVFQHRGTFFTKLNSNLTTQLIETLSVGGAVNDLASKFSFTVWQVESQTRKTTGEWLRGKKCYWSAQMK